MIKFLYALPITSLRLLEIKLLLKRALGFYYVRHTIGQIRQKCKETSKFQTKQFLVFCFNSALILYNSSLHKQARGIAVFFREIDQFSADFCYCLRLIWQNIEIAVKTLT